MGSFATKSVVCVLATPRSISPGRRQPSNDDQCSPTTPVDYGQSRWQPCALRPSAQVATAA